MNRRLFAEFIGTFFFVFVAAGSAAVGYGGLTGGALATGLTLFIFICFFASTSGAHFNPAITLAMYLRGHLSQMEAIRYVAAQLLASASAAALLGLFFLNTCIDIGSTRLSETVLAWQGFGLEALFTFFLTFSVFRASHLKHEALAPAVIGLTVTCSILVIGPLTGGSLNPARSFGPCLVSGLAHDLWLYFTAPFVGAWLGAWTDKWFASLSE